MILVSSMQPGSAVSFMLCLRTGVSVSASQIGVLLKAGKAAKAH